MLFSNETVSKTERFFPCETIKGTNIIINPNKIETRINKVNITAKVFLNFNLFFKNVTNGLAIKVKISDITKYMRIVCI